MKTLLINSFRKLKNFPDLPKVVVIVFLLFLGCTGTKPHAVVLKEGMVLIPEGDFYMGSDDSQSRPDESPKHRVHVDAFWMDQTEVTNAQFKAFVEATGYITTAELPPDWEELKKELP